MNIALKNGSPDKCVISVLTFLVKYVSETLAEKTSNSRYLSMKKQWFEISPQKEVFMDFRTITMVIETGIAIASVVLNIIREGNND